MYGRRRARTRWADFMAERLEEQSFDRCDAAPQFFANYELDVFIEVHMDDLHGTGPRLALDLVQTNFSQKIRRVERVRVLHTDRTEIVPNPKYLRAVLHSMELANSKPAPTPSGAGSVKQKLGEDADLDMQERRLYRGLVGNLQ